MKIHYWKANNGQVIFRLKKLEKKMELILKNNGIDTSKLTIDYNRKYTHDNPFGTLITENNGSKTIIINDEAINGRLDSIEENVFMADSDELFDIFAQEYAIAAVIIVLIHHISEKADTPEFTQELSAMEAYNLVDYIAYREIYKQFRPKIIPNPYIIIRTPNMEHNHIDWLNTMSSAAAYMSISTEKNLYTAMLKYEEGKILTLPNIIDKLVETLEHKYSEYKLM